MPVQLPAGVVPVLQPLTDDQVLVTSPRVSSWRFELLDRSETPIGELEGVEPGGSVEWTASASIKGSGKITVHPSPDQQVDWLNVRIQPVCTISGYSRDVPCGIWLAAAPVEQWDDGQLTLDVELLDKASILAQDVWESPVSGRPETFTAAAGANVLELVKQLITATGERVDAIGTDSAALTRAMVWEPGTTRLQIINELLDAAGFFSLWVDMRGQFRCDRYVTPQARAASFEALAPFTAGPSSLISPDTKIDRDIYSVPNRFVAVGQGTGDTEAPIAVATNENPASPYSHQARGRWITVVETGVEATDPTALQTFADRRLAAASSVAATIPVTHVFLPDLTVNLAVRIVQPSASLATKATVQKTTVVFDGTKMCSSELREVMEL